MGCIDFSPNRRTLATASSTFIVLWDITTGQRLRTLSGHTGYVESVAFSPDGRLLASGSEDKTVKLWDVATGRKLHSITFYDWVASVAFSPDGRTLASAATAGGIELRDVATWRRLPTLVSDPSYYYPTSASSVAFSPDGRTLAWGSSIIMLWDIRTGKQLRGLEGHKDFVESIAFSPDGRILASGSADNTVKLWDVASGHELLTLPGDTGSVWSVAFSPDGHALAYGSNGGMVKLWDVATGQEFRTLVSQTHGMYSTPSVAFSPDGRLLASWSNDGSTRIWDEGSGEQLAGLISMRGSPDWLVVTPDGLFDGSPEAWNQLLWRFNNNTFDVAPVEAFFNEYYYPGLLADIMAGKQPKARASIENKDRRQPTVQLAMTSDQRSLEKQIAKRNLNLKLTLNQSAADAQHTEGSGVKDVRLFRNGSLVKVWRGDLKLDAQGKGVLEATVPIVAGENHFTAYAFNHDNIKSSDATLVVTGADSLKRKGTAYILAVGINQYATSGFNLKFAVPDADTFAKELSAQQAKLGTYANVEVVPLLDSDATKANFLLALGRLAGTNTGSLPAGTPAALAKIQPAQPEDAVIIYFAGHGYAAEEKDHKLFYLIMHEFEPVEVATKVPGAVSDVELGETVEKIDAGLLALLIDACQSGGALDSPDPRQGPMNSKGLAQLAYDKGMYILAAAQGNQAALEVNKLGHGLLTHALVGPQEGLSSAADLDKNGEVVLREWLDYATQRVPQLQEEKIEEARKQGRSLTFFKGTNAASAPNASGAAARGDVSGGVQRPRVFYRREPEPHPPVIANVRTNP